MKFCSFNENYISVYCYSFYVYLFNFKYVSLNFKMIPFKNSQQISKLATPGNMNFCIFSIPNRKRTPHKYINIRIYKQNKIKSKIYIK